MEFIHFSDNFHVLTRPQGTICPWPSCGKQFTAQKNMRRHYENQHLKQSKCVCPECGKHFGDKTNLSAHMRVVHRGEKFVCPYEHCKAKFTTKGSLTKHVNTHKNTHAHVCELCGKGFNRILYLQNHIDKHNNIKRNACTICDAKFTNLHNLKHHIKVVHDPNRPKSTPKVHQCDICNKMFANAKNLKEHKNGHLNPEKFMCQLCGSTFPYRGSLQSHFDRKHRKQDIVAPQ